MVYEARGLNLLFVFSPLLSRSRERDPHTAEKDIQCIRLSCIHRPFFYFQTIGSRRTLKKKRVHRGEICIDGCEKWFSVISLIMNYTYKRKRAPPNNETCSSIRCYYLAPAVLCIGGSV
jgi:hypothetical protein